MGKSRLLTIVTIIITFFFLFVKFVSIKFPSYFVIYSKLFYISGVGGNFKLGRVGEGKLRAPLPLYETQVIV